MKVRSLRLSYLSFFLAAATILSTAQTYTVTDLGTLPGGTWSWAHGINSTGQITGAANSGGTLSDTFLFSSGAMTSLGTLGGTTGVGNGINASGQIAGYSTISSGTYRAFLATGGELTDLGDLGGGSATAYAINDVGQVVGSAVTSDGSNHPFLYSDGKMIDLGTLGSSGNSWWNTATGINNSGVIVGTSYDAHGNFFGFFWSNGKMSKMGTLGGPWSQAYAVNNKNQITGLAYTSPATGRLAHAFIATGTGKLKDLGTISGKTSTTWGFGINDAGVIVGQSTFANTYHAFIYSGGKMTDLNKLIPAGSGWTLEEADSINATGQIIGLGMHNGQERAFLLSPK